MLITILLLIVGVTIGLLIWYVISAPKFVITLSSGGDTYEDAFIKVCFPYGNPENLRNLKQVPVILENKTTVPIMIDWDASTFIDPSGQSNRVIHAGVKLVDRNAAQSPSVVGSRSKFNDLMIPSDNIYWRDSTDKKPGDWEEKPLLIAWARNESFQFRTVLTLRIGQESKSYEFEFSAQKSAKAPVKEAAQPAPSEAPVTQPTAAQPVMQPADAVEQLAPSLPPVVAPIPSPTQPVLSASNNSGKYIVIGAAALILAGSVGYWGYTQKRAEDEQAQLLATRQAEEAKHRADAEVQQKIQAAVDQARREAEDKARTEFEGKLAAERAQQQAQQQAAPSGMPQQTTSNASNQMRRASTCPDFNVCLNSIIEASFPRTPDVIEVSATRLGEFNKAQRGDRKVARAKNQLGLEEFQRRNYAEAIDLLKQAAIADPADVEILSNLGFVSIQANRQAEASQALASALILDPRRTSTWIPVAQLYTMQGKSELSIRALLLGYEFSANKEKTIAFFVDKSKAADSDAMKLAYSGALQRIGEQNQYSNQSSRDPTPEQVMKAFGGMINSIQNQK